MNQQRLPSIQSLLPEHIFRQFEQGNTNTNVQSSSRAVGPSHHVHQPHNLPGVSQLYPGMLHAPNLRDPEEYPEEEAQETPAIPSPGPGDYERDHVCIYCNRRCSRPSLLRVHMRIHTGATPYECPHPNCGRVFNVKSNMKRHYARHIPKNPSPESGNRSQAAGAFSDIPESEETYVADRRSRPYANSPPRRS